MRTSENNDRPPEANRHEGTSALARQLWEAAGRPEGRDQEFWFKAESKLAGAPRLSVKPMRQGGGTARQAPALALPPAGSSSPGFRHLRTDQTAEPATAGPSNSGSTRRAKSPRSQTRTSSR